MTNTDSEMLERAIDAHGLADVLATLASICTEKAGHIRASYGDAPGLARSWELAGRNCSRVSESRPVAMVSP